MYGVSTFAKFGERQKGRQVYRSTDQMQPIFGFGYSVQKYVLLPLALAKYKVQIILLSEDQCFLF